MRKKFKIFYCKNHENSDKAGTRYKPTGKDMLVMNSAGVFFVYNGETYYPSITKLSVRIGNYDVVWEES